MTDGCSMNVDVVTCAALTGQSEPPGKAALSARRPSRAARTTHLPTKQARTGCIGCNRLLVNEPDPFSPLFDPFLLNLRLMPSLLRIFAKPPAFLRPISRCSSARELAGSVTGNREEANLLACQSFAAGYQQGSQKCPAGAGCGMI
jgi:hypothetical protein